MIIRRPTLASPRVIQHPRNAQSRHVITRRTRVRLLLIIAREENVNRFPVSLRTFRFKTSTALHFRGSGGK